MKQIIIFLFILLTILCSAQEDWAPTGAIWHYNYTNQMVNGYVKIESIGDTMINGITCKILEKTRVSTFGFNPTIDTAYIGTEYTYIDSNMVYYYRHGRFFVLYDFNAVANDSWIISGEDPNPAPYCLDSIGYIDVDSTTTVNINSHNLKGLYINSPDTSDWDMRGLTIERIGCLGYMFPEVSDCIVDYYEGGLFRCYYDSVIGYYQPNSSPCDYVYSANIVETKNAISDIRLYPNPIQDNVYIELANVSPKQEIEINIYSVIGVKIRSIMLIDKISLLDFSSLSNGCYYIEAVMSDNIKITRKIIKNAP